MSQKMFLHELPDVADLYSVVGREKGIEPSLVEKDYWIMHCLLGLKAQGYHFELKGGTSLSKGYGIIERFSEDIDIQIHPYFELKVGSNHTKESHIRKRRDYFDSLATQIQIAGLKFRRDHEFDDAKQMRGAGIRGDYSATTKKNDTAKDGILLEVGFDQTTPYEKITISSWAFDKADSLNLDIIDNRAIGIKCYCPEYTFVEKLQTISTKFRQQQKDNCLPSNFLRNYYDVYRLLQCDRVLDFIGTDNYFKHKSQRFRESDEFDLTKNEAFLLADAETFRTYINEFQSKSDLYYGAQPNFNDIMNAIQEWLTRL